MSIISSWRMRTVRPRSWRYSRTFAQKSDLGSAWSTSSAPRLNPLKRSPGRSSEPTRFLARGGSGVLVFLAAWQIGVVVHKVPSYLLPAPTEIARTFVSEFPRLLQHGWITTY